MAAKVSLVVSGRFTPTIRTFKLKKNLKAIKGVLSYPQFIVQDTKPYSSYVVVPRSKKKD